MKLRKGVFVKLDASLQISGFLPMTNTKSLMQPSPIFDSYFRDERYLLSFIVSKDGKKLFWSVIKGGPISIEVKYLKKAHPLS